jgi:transposase
MSQALLYHAFHVQGYRCVNWEFDEHRVLMHLEPQEHRVCCPQCNSRKVIRRGSKTRWIKNVPIQSDLTWLVVEIPRVECRECGAVQQIKTGLAEEKRSYTHALARYVVELCGFMTLQGVANHLGIHWDLVKEIHKDHLHRHFSEPNLNGLRRLAIDEIHLGKKLWKTIVLDLDSGAIVFVGDGKKGSVLRPFFQRLKRAKARIEAVAVDFGKAYIAAVRRHLPDAVLVFDRFHLVKLFNQKLTQIRRDTYHHASEKLQKKVLKGTRWLLLKRPENLDDKRGERQRLEEALRLNEGLATAYYLKEDLCQFWEQKSKEAARRHLQQWYQDMLASGVRLLQDLARFVLAHQDGLLAWYDHPISTGPLEGTNRKIRTLQATHYGFRDQEYFVLRLYSLHRTRYALVG